MVRFERFSRVRVMLKSVDWGEKRREEGEMGFDIEDLK